jgi:nitrogen fixation protein
MTMMRLVRGMATILGGFELVLEELPEETEMPAAGAPPG